LPKTDSPFDIMNPKAKVFPSKSSEARQIVIVVFFIVFLLLGTARTHSLLSYRVVGIARKIGEVQAESARRAG